MTSAAQSNFKQDEVESRDGQKGWNDDPANSKAVFRRCQAI